MAKAPWTSHRRTASAPSPTRPPSAPSPTPSPAADAPLPPGARRRCPPQLRRPPSMVGARAPACASYVGGWILAPAAEVRFPMPRSTTRSKGPRAPFPSPCQLPPAPPPASDHAAVALPAKLYHGRQQGTTHISGDTPPNCSKLPCLTAGFNCC